MLTPAPDPHDPHDRERGRAVEAERQQVAHPGFELEVPVLRVDLLARAEDAEDPAPARRDHDRQPREVVLHVLVPDLAELGVLVRGGLAG